ncbi:MAG: YeeE/YedE family protein [Bacteriovoracaceae bacterium]|nr:YeeE/YedE family protein [Bacteriovoracaceae bacterium]
MRNLIGFIAGIVFAVGLSISGMTQVHIVKGFLNIFGEWDPRLIGVMGGAILVHAISFRLITKRKSPILNKEFLIPNIKTLDLKLVAGAALFGLGWGWAGICPGPGLTSLTSGAEEFYYFISAMIVGMVVFQFLQRRGLFK